MATVLDGIIGTYSVPANTTPGEINIPASEKEGRALIAYQFPDGRTNDIKLQYKTDGEDTSQYVPINAADGLLTTDPMVANSAPDQLWSAVAENITVVVWRVRNV